VALRSRKNISGMPRVHKKERKMFSGGQLLHTEEDQMEHVTELWNNFMIHHFYLSLITESQNVRDWKGPLWVI